MAKNRIHGLKHLFCRLFFFKCDLFWILPTPLPLTLFLRLPWAVHQAFSRLLFWFFFLFRFFHSCQPVYYIFAGFFFFPLQLKMCWQSKIPTEHLNFIYGSKEVCVCLNTMYEKFLPDVKTTKGLPGLLSCSIIEEYIIEFLIIIFTSFGLKISK